MLVVLVGHGGFPDLPNPVTDEVARVLRLFDRMQRPSGQDLPIERYFAWEAQRDAGSLPRELLSENLQGLVDVQRAMVVQIKRIRTTSDAALSILDAYLGAHIRTHQAMEEVLAGRRLGDAAREKVGEERVKAAYDELRRARALRADVEKRLGVQL